MEEYFDNMIDIFRKNHILVTNDRLNAHREKYLLNNDKLSNIYYNYTKKFRTEKEAVYCILHHIDINDIPRCPICGKLSKFTGRYYNTTCGSCNYNAWDKKIELTRQNTTKEAILRGKEKSKLTCLRKYGVPYGNAYSTPELKQYWENKWLKDLGTTNPGQTAKAKHKRKQTMLSKYGVEHNFQLLDSSKHAKQIWNEQHDSIISKIENTCLNRYGVRYYAQTKNFVTQSQETLINHYGSIKEAYKIKKERGQQTKLLRYGDKFYHNSEQMSETLKVRHTKFEIEHNCIQYKKLIDIYGQGWKSLELPII